MTVPHGFSTWKWGTFQLKLYWSVVLFYTDPFKSAQRQWWWRDHVYTHIFIVFREISLTPLMFPGVDHRGGARWRAGKNAPTMNINQRINLRFPDREDPWHSVTQCHAVTLTCDTHQHNRDTRTIRWLLETKWCKFSNLVLRSNNADFTS